MLFSLALLPFSSLILSFPFQIPFFVVRFGLAAISGGWEKVFHRSREVYACINPMRFMFSSMAFFVHVTDKLQRAHVINYNQGLIL